MTPGAAGPGSSPDPFDALAALRHSGPRRVPLENFRPLANGLDWRLGRRYWEASGPSAFLGGDVPYTINNDGRLAEDAARVFAQAHSDGDQPLRALEVGAGSGLFARLFLRALRRLAPAVAARTRLVVTDASAAMARALEENGLLDGLRDAVEVRVASAPDLPGLPEGAFHAVFANYLLDNLPSTALRLRPDRVDELLFRASLPAEGLPGAPDPVALRTGLERGDPAAEDTLLGVWPHLQLEWRAEPRDPAALPFADVLPARPAAGECFALHGAGALAFLSRARGLLAPGGFLLVADYAAPSGGAASPSNLLQHFGGSVANGVDFSQIDRWAAALPGWRAFAPEPPSADLQLRLICEPANSGAIAAFRVCFEGTRWDRPGALLRQAAARVDEHRLEDARGLFLQALEERPWCWHILERAASFLLYHAKDPAAAETAIAVGLDLHPRHPGLWNLLGDLRYERRDLAGAGEAFRAAIALHPREVRGRLNLAYVLGDTGRADEGLRLLGEAFALDDRVEFRDSIRRKQEDLLSRVSARERERLILQLNRVREWPGEPPSPTPA